MTTVPQRRDPQLYSVPKPRKSRTKSGCLSCRARRKKCDEQKPVCRTCERLHLDCQWPSTGLTIESIPVISFAAESSAVEPVHNVVNPGNANAQLVVMDSGLHKDEYDNSSPTEVALLTELQNLTRTFRAEGLLPYDMHISSNVHERISKSEGREVAMLYDHFCYKTAPWLVNGGCHDNPVSRYIVPLTATDELVLHTVLAISGNHLCHSVPKIAPVAMKYYSYVLQSLHKRVGDWLNDSKKDYKPLFAAIILICHCEFLQGNTYGATLEHLKACRAFVEIAHAQLKDPEQDPEHQDFVVFLMEHYGYFVLISNLRSLPLEEHINLGLEFSVSLLPLIRHFSSFGSILAFEPESFSLIPNIARLALQRKQNPSIVDDDYYRSEYMRLLSSLKREKITSDTVIDTCPPNARTRNEAQIAISIKIDALLLFLNTSFYESSTSQAQLSEICQAIIDHTMKLIPHVNENHICYSMFWSTLLTGSYIRDDGQQQDLVQQLMINKSETPPYLKRGVDLLQWLWEECNDFEIGLESLEKVTLAHSSDLCGA